MALTLKFWGVRGSIPFPGPNSIRYGGNTTCLEVRTDAGDRIILDAGTGIFPLAQTLLGSMPLDCHIFITHTHWDHIQGLPFFIPLFIPGNVVRVHGAFDPVSQRDIRDVLSRQMEYCYFPVREVELKAEVHYTTLRENVPVRVGDATVTGILMNHPVLNLGYRIDYQGKSIFFTGDHEWPFNIYDPTDEYFQEYERLIGLKNQAILELIHGVDLLVADSAYTEDEYTKAKMGWGHGTYDSCIRLAREAGVKHLCFTHHEPTRSDDHLERLFNEAMARHPRQPGDPEYHLAYEGMEITL